MYANRLIIYGDIGDLFRCCTIIELESSLSLSIPYTVLKPYIMVAMRYFIRQLSLDGNRTSIAASGLTNANALDFDYRFVSCLL